MRKPLRRPLRIAKEFTYGVGAGNAIGHGLPLSPCHPSRRAGARFVRQLRVELPSPRSWNRCPGPGSRIGSSERGSIHVVA
ncbi:hypothetical protein [Streptomyces sp. NPDC002785]|uniref:hypothetical protein n=1 Tax=Streptomyces sp. NPDC002785 TaxID=3154543 RepID=UPI0033349198